MKYSEYYLGNGTNPPLYQEHKVLTADIDLNLNFRNQYLKIETTIISARAFFDSYYYGNYKLSFGGNLLLGLDQTKFYLGPNFRYGRIRNELFIPRFEYIGLGIDFYLNKFHLIFYYDKIINTYINTDRNYISMYGFDIGYAFNLESFRKKK